jgi:hypothetical protein
MAKSPVFHDWRHDLQRPRRKASGWAESISRSIVRGLSGRYSTIEVINQSMCVLIICVSAFALWVRSLQQARSLIVVNVQMKSFSARPRSVKVAIWLVFSTPQHERVNPSTILSQNRTRVFSPTTYISMKSSTSLQIPPSQ